MAQRFLDSFSHYATADPSSKYEAVGGNLSIVSGGRSGNCLQSLPQGSLDTSLRKTLDSQSTWFVGFGFWISASPSPVACQILSFWDGTTTTLQVALWANTDGTLQFAVGGTLVGAKSPAIPLGVWNHLQVSVSIATSIAANSCQLLLNSATAITLATGTNTKVSANASANWIVLGDWQGNAAHTTLKYCDLYINDGTGSVCNTLLGDLTVGVAALNATATYTDLALTGASTAVTAVATYNGDTSYLSSSTAGDRASFTVGTTPTAIDTVYGIQLVAGAEKVGSGARSVAPFVRSGITNYDQTAQALVTGYRFYLSEMSLNPATGVAWTASDIAALEPGFKVV